MKDEEVNDKIHVTEIILIKEGNVYALCTFAKENAYDEVKDILENIIMSFR